jgi:hypothetical protein
MTIEQFLIYWASLTVISIALGLLVSLPKRKEISLSEFMAIAISSATIVSSFNLLYRITTSEELQKLLQFDIWVMVIGIVAVIWLSIQQIWNIFK